MDDISQTLTIVKRRIRAKFWRWCRYLGWPEMKITDWVEEVSGEGMSFVLNSLDAGELDRNRFHAFCVNKAKSLARDELLKETTRVQTEADLVADSQFREDFHDPIPVLLESLSLNTFLTGLSESQREVIALYCVAGLEVREISGLQGVPEKTVYTNLRRARIKLAKLAQEENPSRRLSNNTTPESSPDQSPPTTRPPPQ